jgi:hypothetical protein
MQPIIVEATAPIVTKEGDLILPGTRGVLLGWCEDGALRDPQNTALVEVCWESYMFADPPVTIGAKRVPSSTRWNLSEMLAPADADFVGLVDGEGFHADAPITSLRVWRP